jgi:hypothetical protein
MYLFCSDASTFSFSIAHSHFVSFRFVLFCFVENLVLVWQICTFRFVLLRYGKNARRQWPAAGDQTLICWSLW